MFLKKKKAINEVDRQDQDVFQGREHLPSPQFNSQKLKINKQTKKMWSDYPDSRLWKTSVKKGTN